MDQQEPGLYQDATSRLVRKRGVGRERKIVWRVLAPIIGLLMCVLCGLWLVYVYPTPWRYYKQGTLNLRVNRFSGRTEQLELTGWKENRVQDPLAPLVINGVSIDFPKLARGLTPPPSPGVSENLNTAMFGLRYGDYPKAVMALESIAKDSSLTDIQRSLADQVVVEVKRASGIR